MTRCVSAIIGSGTFQKRWISVRGSNAGGERFRGFTAAPDLSALQRFERASPIDVNDRVELAPERDVEVVAQALRFGFVDDADRSLEARLIERSA